MSQPAAAIRPRVVLLTQPTLFGSEIINRLAEEEGIDLVAIGFSVRIIKNRSPLVGVAMMLRRVGWRYLSAIAVESNISWLWLRLTGRPSGLKKVSDAVRTLDDVNSPATLEWLRRLAPDFVVSYYFNHWIGGEVSTIPRRACINIHPSRLPELRGPDPAFRALERGLTSTGITIHEVSDQIDAGRILHQEMRDIPPGASRFGLFLILIREGADVAARWMAGKIPLQTPVVQDPKAGDYTTFPTPAEVRSLSRAGHPLMRVSEWCKALSEVR